MSDRRPPSDEMCPNPVTCPFVDSTEPHPVSDHPGMSDDRRPEKSYGLHVLEDCGHNAQEEPTTRPCCGFTHREASPADLIAVVRRGVESGTIKGEVNVDWRLIDLELPHGDYIVIPDEGER